MTALGSTLTREAGSPTGRSSTRARASTATACCGLWLAGGAANTGGAALARFFTPEAMAGAVEPRLDPDPADRARLLPAAGDGRALPGQRPRDGLAARGPGRRTTRRSSRACSRASRGAEGTGYRRLAELGAPSLRSVRTVGGGAANRAWARIRARVLGVPLEAARSTEAAYGTALLAARALGC